MGRVDRRGIGRAEHRRQDCYREHEHENQAAEQDAGVMEEFPPQLPAPGGGSRSGGGIDQDLGIGGAQ
jgi:hypothetical protein